MTRAQFELHVPWSIKADDPDNLVRLTAQGEEQLIILLQTFCTEPGEEPGSDIALSLEEARMLGKALIHMADQMESIT